MDDRVTPFGALERALAAKEARRRDLAALPFLEKVRIVVQLQRMAVPVLRTRGIERRVWRLDDGEQGGGVSGS